MAEVTEKAKNLEQRVRVLEDAEAIKKLKARYTYAVDSQDTNGVMNTFDEGWVREKMTLK